MLGNTCTQVHSKVTTQQESSNSFRWWVILAERNVEYLAPLTGEKGFTPAVKKQWQVVNYDDLLRRRDEPADMIFYGGYNNGGHLITYEPPLSISVDRTVHIYEPNTKGNVPLWPMNEISSSCQYITEWYLMRGAKVVFITEDNFDATTAEDCAGNTDIQFELCPNEIVDLSHYNVSLASLNWVYQMRLLYLIRVNSRTHLAVASDPEDSNRLYCYNLSRPCRVCDYIAKVARN